MRRIVPDRDGSAARAMCDACRDRPDYPGDAAMLRAAARLVLACLECDGEVAGAVSRPPDGRPGNVHLAVLPRWRGRWATKGFMRDIVRWCANGGAEMRTVALTPEGRRLVEGFGFKQQDDRRTYARSVHP